MTVNVVSIQKSTLECPFHWILNAEVSRRGYRMASFIGLAASRGPLGQNETIYQELNPE